MTTRKKLMLLFLLTSFAFTACSKASAGVAPEKTAAQTAALQEAAPSSTQEAEPTEALPTSSGPEESSRSNEQKSAGRTAVVYFSATGTTAEIARLIAEETGADLLEIVPETAYTSEDLNYHDDNCRANREMNDDTARPAISSDFSHLSEYSVIYVGHPIWWGTAPRIIQTFFESCDLSQATVYTFCTSGGRGIEQSVKDLQNLYPDVNIVSGKRLNGASAADVKSWISSLD